MRYSLLIAVLLLFFANHVQAGWDDVAQWENDDWIGAEELKQVGSRLYLRSKNVLVLDEMEDVPLIEKGVHQKRPIASITKLMTAMVVIDQKADMEEALKITDADRDRLRNSGSKLRIGTVLKRKDMLLMSLVASENRAASALARNFPGGMKGFIAAMNKKAKALGLNKTRFRGPTGLHSGNISTALDLAHLVTAAYEYPLIRELSVTRVEAVRDLKRNRIIKFRNTNRLIHRDSWNIGLSKTGYISDSGFCLVMHTEINERPVIIVLLNSRNNISRYGDSDRIRKWLIRTERKARLQHAKEDFSF